MIVKTKTKKIRKPQFTDWLNTAIPFSIWYVSDKKHVIEARDFIFKDIGEEYYLSKDKAKDNAMLMSISLNLWVGFCNGSPIQISLNKNKYSRNAVYGKAFYSYDRTTRLLDELENRGYMQRKPGCFFEDNKKETRIWGTEKLLRLFLVEYKFQLFGDVYQDKTPDLIHLNKKKPKTIWDKKKKKWREIEIKVPVKYDPTEETITMKNNLIKYNSLAKEETVTIKIKGENLIKAKVLTETIIQGLSTGAIRLISSELDYKDPLENQYSSNTDNSSVQSVFSYVPGLRIIQHSYKKYSYTNIALSNDDLIEPISLDTTLLSITNTLHSQQWQGIEPKTALFLYLLWQKKLFSMIKVKGENPKDKRIKKRLLMKEERPLIDFGIKYLEFEINKKSLHRVFNEGSKDFDMGGRFFGAFYQRLPECVRDCIQVNGNDSVEIDYSGMHLRMLYHRLGEDYRKDPYGFSRARERKKYKFVSLISINAEEKDAAGAIYDKLKKEGIRYQGGTGSIKKMMDAFREYHAPIKDDLFSGVGVDLQNKDSIIMEKILMRLHDLGICGLPVHDSVICEKEHAESLYKIMMEEYEKLMGFYPVLKPEIDISAFDK